MSVGADFTLKMRVKMDAEERLEEQFLLRNAMLFCERRKFRFSLLCIRIMSHENICVIAPVLPTIQITITKFRKCFEGNKNMSEDTLNVAVVGAGHLDGIIKKIDSDEDINLNDIEHVPSSSRLTKIIGWGIPAIIIGSIFFIGLNPLLQSIDCL